MRSILSISKQRKTVLLTLIVLLVPLIGVLDYWSGSQMKFGVVYLIPVLLAATISRRVGLIVSLACALMGPLSHLALSGNYSSHLHLLWDFGSHLTIFSLAALLRSNLIQSRQREREMARTDHLTGAMNRRAFYELSETEISRANRYNRPLTVAYIDIDDFKTVNDNLGHAAGDDLLRAVVAAINTQTRILDIVARLGGDEFVLLLPETGQKAARSSVGKIQKTLEKEAHKHNWAITFSIGVLTCTKMPPTIDKMIEAADSLMYEVKQNGKNSTKYSVYAG